MLRSSTLVKCLALAIALAAHGALALVLVTPQEIRTEGGGGAAEVRLGNAFADMAAGTLSAMQAETTAETAPYAETPPEPARPTAAAPLAAVTPEAAAPSGGAPATPITSDTPSAEAPAEAPRVEETAPSSPAQPQMAAKPSRAAEEKLVAEPEADPAVSRSLRPEQRSAEFEQAHKAPPTPEPTQPAQTTRSAAGNAPQDARAGDATGTASATETQRGTSDTADSTGNAEASNYPGLVMQRLAQAGKPRVNTRGTAVVAFSVNAAGALNAVSLARSSGSSTLDQAALQLVRSASPFPPPPQGAQRNFSIQIKGR